MLPTPCPVDQVLKVIFYTPCVLPLSLHAHKKSKQKNYRYGYMRNKGTHHAQTLSSEKANADIWKYDTSELRN